MSAYQVTPFTFIGSNARPRTVQAHTVGELRVHQSLDDSGLVNVTSPLGLRLCSYADWQTAVAIAERLQREFPAAKWADGDGVAVFGDMIACRRALQIAREVA